MRSIEYGQWPKRTLPFGVIDKGSRKVARGFDLHKVISPRAKSMLAQSVENVPLKDVHWSKFFTDCASAVLSRLGDVYNPPREMVAALTTPDRLFVLFEALVEQDEMYEPAGFCGNPLCNDGRGTFITPPPFSLKGLPINEPEPGDFDIIDGRWAYVGAWPEMGVRSATFYVATAAEEEEREKRNRANANYPAGDFWFLSQVIVDLNGEGPLTEAQLERGRRAGVADPRRGEDAASEESGPVFDEDLPLVLLRLARDPLGGPPLGIDLRLDLACTECGTVNENGARVDLAKRFFGGLGLKGTPSTKLKLTSSSKSPAPTPSA